MGMKFLGLAGLLVLVAAGLISCGTTSSTANAGTGVLYVTTQGNTAVSVWAIDLSTGVISTNNNATPTGIDSSAMVASPAGDALFVANNVPQSAAASPAPAPVLGTISTYTINADGSVSAGNTVTETNAISPMGMAIDPGGKFLFVANQGTFNLTDTPESIAVPGSISVFSVSGNALTEIPGSPFSTECASPACGTPDVSGTGPVSVAVSPNSQYLYVANQFTGTVRGFSIDGSGALTMLPGGASAVGNAPRAVTITPDGNFLLVANQGTNNISSFAACTNATLSCVTPTGVLTPVAGSPFSANGLGPVNMAIESDSQGEYLYVADYQSNQISQFKVGVNSGVLTALSPATLSAGTNPSGIAVRAGSGTLLSTGGTTYYVFATNQTSGSISSFSYDSTAGTLTQIGSGTLITTGGLPSALTVR